ncbi:CIC11C00000000931 [Sungouiella intermedia]|uniref:CIC11C00000000931 n=1 Tax=Sungouiella intermedia TaxID=45354 RepID=A0A1L0CX78_9ASCO|nr:CIC11C00000000931 [[Candida] intermedia]SGZ58627.1 CIC11C00000002683 [[Candida] intermedia]
MFTIYVVATFGFLAVGIAVCSCYQNKESCPVKQRWTCSTRKCIEPSKDTGIYNMEVDEDVSSDESSDDEKYSDDE